MNKDIQNLYHIYYVHCNEQIYNMTDKELLHYFLNLIHINHNFNDKFIKLFGNIQNNTIKIFIDFCKEIDIYCTNFVTHIPVASKRNHMSFQEYIYNYIDTNFEYLDMDKFQYYDVWYYAIIHEPEIELLYSHLTKIHNDYIAIQLSKSFTTLDLLKKKI